MTTKPLRIPFPDDAPPRLQGRHVSFNLDPEAGPHGLVRMPRDPTAKERRYVRLFLVYVAQTHGPWIRLLQSAGRDQ